MIYMFCANGVEEVEALAALDVIRRAGLEVITVGIPGTEVSGPHNITFKTDMTIAEFESKDRRADAVILPGGGVGTETLANNKTVCDLVKKTYAEGGFICAICAAPSVFGRLGLLQGKKATCYPGFEHYLKGASVLPDKVVVDGKVITAKGMGCAIQFGLAVISALKGKEAADKIADSIMF